MIVANSYRQAQDAQDSARLLEMDEALRQYNGEYPLPLTLVKGEPDDNSIPNFALDIVDTNVGLMLGDGCGLEIEIENGETEDSESVESPEETYLESVWPKEQRNADLIEIETNGAIFGHCWAEIVLTDGVPSVLPVDPTQMSVSWDPLNYRMVEKYISQCTGTDSEGNLVTYRKEAERSGSAWMVSLHESRNDNPRFQQVGDFIPWPYSFPPFFHCKNLPVPSEFYGRADLCKSILSQIYYIHRVDSLINRILRLHAFPKTVAKNIQPSNLVIGSDGVLFLVSASKETDMYHLEMQSDLAAARDKRREWTDELYDLAHLPGVARGKLDRTGGDSGIALKVLYAPAAKHIGRKRVLRTPFITSLVRALLEIGGKNSKAKIELHWPPVIPGNDKEAAEIAILKKQIGFSNDTLIHEAGGDPNEEKKKREAETTDMGNQLLTAFDQGKGMMGNG